MSGLIVRWEDNSFMKPNDLYYECRDKFYKYISQFDETFETIEKRIECGLGGEIFSSYIYRLIKNKKTL
jgi:hypothetical protein